MGLTRERAFLNRELIEPAEREDEPTQGEWYQIEARTALLIASMLRFSVRVHWREDRDRFNELARRFEAVAGEAYTVEWVDIALTDYNFETIEMAWNSVEEEFPLSEFASFGDADE